MNILVTGANGFIGSYLVAELKKQGCVVYEHNRKKGDLKNADTIKQYTNIDVIYHLAARTYVPESWEKPYEYIIDNNVILMNVLEYCRTNKTKLVFVSTYLYGNPEYLPIDEKHKCVANSPYHLCKMMGEETCKFYCENYDVDITVVRPFNVYGKGQNKDFLLPKVYEQVVDVNSNTVEVFDLEPKRDYIYVEDLVEVLGRILPYIEGYNVFNIGAGESYSVKEVIDIIQKEYETDKKIIELFSERKNEVMDCVADISHLEEAIGKVKMMSLVEGIHKWHLMDGDSNENIDA